MICVWCGLILSINFLRFPVLDTDPGCCYVDDSRVAKLIGDSRAVVAEKGFNRPYEKVLIAKCGEVR